MAKQTINLGTGELTGDGESIRTAFDKINKNFDETYADIVALTSSAFSGDYNDLTNTPTIPVDVGDLTDTDNLLGSTTGDITFTNSTISAPDDTSITIITDFDNFAYTWEFNPDGTQTLPGDVIFNSGRINNSVSDGGGLQVEADTDFEIKVVSGIDTTIWSFEPNGSITFPDATIQTTAWTGVGDLTGSVFADDSTVMVDAVNNTLHAGTVNAVAFQGSLVSTGGVNAPLQIFSGQQEQTGNTIFINPYGSNTYLIHQAETYEWRTGPYLSSGNPYIQFTTAGAFEAYQGAYFVGDLTGNLDGDVTGSVFADDSTLLVDGVNGTIPYSVISDVQVTESDLLVDFANIVTTQIQTNGLPINTTATGTLTVNGQFTVEESFSSTPTTKFFEIETGAGNNRLLRTGVNMSAFAQGDGPQLDLTSYRSSPANGDAGPELVLRASTGASVNDVIATIGTQVTDTTDGAVNSKISFTTKNNGAEITPLTITGSTVDMQTADQVSISNENGAIDIYGGVEFNNGTTSFQAGNSVDFNCPVDFSGATVTGLSTTNNAGVAYQFGYSAHNAVGTSPFGDFTVNSTAMNISVTATENVQGTRIEISGITASTSASTGLIYVQRRINSGSWNVWSSFIVNGALDHFNHSFVDFYNTGGPVTTGDTVEYKLTNATADNSNYLGSTAGTVEFELFLGFQFTATEIPVSYNLTTP